MATGAVFLIKFKFELAILLFYNMATGAAF